MERSVREVLNLYNPGDPLEKAWTIPAPWYFDERIERLERDSVFATTWQMAGRLDQVQEKGAFFTAEIAGEPESCARFTTCAGIMPRRWSPKQKAARNNFAAPITGGPMGMMAR